MRGIVTKGVASVFDVETQSGEKVTALARGKLKRGGEIYVGDTVELSKEGSRFVITEVLPRKNCLIRPYVANVDVVFAVIAPVPKPDLTLVDKLIVDAFTAEGEPTIVGIEFLRQFEHTETAGVHEPCVPHLHDFGNSGGVSAAFDFRQSAGFKNVAFKHGI